MSALPCFPKNHVQVVVIIHVGALPGTSGSCATLGAILDVAVREAHLYRDAGVDALVVENMHDVPYTNRTVGPKITAAMTRLAEAVRRESHLPTGIQILAGANRESLAAAFAAGCEFISSWIGSGSSVDARHEPPRRRTRVSIRPGPANAAAHAPGGPPR